MINVLEIIKEIYWGKDENIYFSPKDSKYELLVDYLNSGSIQDIRNDIKKLEKFRNIKSILSKNELENHIVYQLEGFLDCDDGNTAHIAGAHDLSPSIHYDIKKDLVSIKHPNIPSLQRYFISLNSLIHLLIKIEAIKNLLISKTLEI